MIEFLVDGGGFITVNPAHIVYIKNDSGQALIYCANGSVFLPQMAYDDLLDLLQRTGLMVYLDKETRDGLNDDDDEAEEE